MAPRSSFVLAYYAKARVLLSSALIIYNNKMHGIRTIIKWEISRVFSNWQRAAAVFIIPAAVMMAALNIFPYLINYMSTGSVTQKPIIVANAPDSFLDYLDETEGSTIYTYEFMSEDEFITYWKSGDAVKGIEKGDITVLFYKDDSTIYIGCNGNSALSMERADSFRSVVLDPYCDDLADDSGSMLEINTFNPITKILDYRTDANYQASRVIPAMLVLLIYYCVYSMMSDMFASERDRGFYDKLLMTPVSPKHIVLGKIISCTILVSGATYMTFLFLFISSWLNRSNSSTSLIPFGLMLLPGQLLAVAIVIPVTAFLCATICLSIIFSIRRMKDVIMNLQMPLIYLMADLFFQMFSGDSGILEFLIPIHGSIALIKAVFRSNFVSWQLVFVLIASILPSMLLLHRTYVKEGYIFDKRKKRS